MGGVVMRTSRSSQATIAAPTPAQSHGRGSAAIAPSSLWSGARKGH
jgi:hypothetical protein